MAIAADEFDSRIDAIVAAFEAARFSTLGRNLPKPVTVHKGPHRWQTPGAGDLAVFISRAGTRSVSYFQRGGSAEVTMIVAVVAATYSVAGNDADMETLVNTLAANVAKLLFSLTKNTGTAAWQAGIWRSSVAITERNEQQQTVELEPFEFDVTFEVTYA